jgi:hypothetical protein
MHWRGSTWRNAYEISNDCRTQAGFPESFESPDFTMKASYNSNNIIDLSIGNRTLAQAILANTVICDKYNLPGKQCIRMQQKPNYQRLCADEFRCNNGRLCIEDMPCTETEMSIKPYHESK